MFLRRWLGGRSAYLFRFSLEYAFRQGRQYAW